MTHADIIDVRGLSLSAASSAAVERFDALIDDLYYYRPGVQDRLDALLQEFPESSGASNGRATERMSAFRRCIGIDYAGARTRRPQA